MSHLRQRSGGTQFADVVTVMTIACHCVPNAKLPGKQNLQSVKTFLKNIGSFLLFEMGLRWSNTCATQRTDISMRKPECHSAEVVFTVGQHRCCAVSFSRNQV